MCQTERESPDKGHEGHGSRKLCAYHHSSLTNHPSAKTASHKAATRSSDPALRAVPRYDAAKYPSIKAILDAMKGVMACWKTKPGCVEWCGYLFEGMRRGVCLQMVVNGIHLQHKRGVKWLSWKFFYEWTAGIRTG